MLDSAAGPTEAYILDEQGEPVRAGTWAQLAEFDEDFERRRIGKDYVGPWRISTVFLIHDHDFAGKGPPVLWETMVFEGEGSADHYCDRYTSRQAAIDGHARVVAALQAGKQPNEIDNHEEETPR